MLSAADVKGIYCDTYNLYLKYHGQRNSEEMWGAFIEEQKQILTKYKNSSLCLRHLTGIWEQLEKEHGYFYGMGEYAKNERP